MLAHHGTNPDQMSVGTAIRYLDHADDLHEIDRDIVKAAIVEWSNDAF